MPSLIKHKHFSTEETIAEIKMPRATNNSKTSSSLAPGSTPTSGCQSGIDPSVIADLDYSLGQLKNILQNNSITQDVDISSSNDINGIIKNLVSAVQALTTNLITTQEKVDNLERRMRSQEDELDETKQRGMKGNILITSLPNKTKGKVCLIKTSSQLKEENISLTNHIISLTKDKFGVDLPATDITACHHLPKGGVVVRIHNRKEGSAWESIIQKIKEGAGQEMNVFYNFQLTQRRSNLLFEVRQLKRSNKISKYFTDENGHIKIRIGVNDRDKHRITYFWNSGETVTLNKDELIKFVHKHVK